MSIPESSFVIAELVLSGMILMMKFGWNPDLLRMCDRIVADIVEGVGRIRLPLWSILCWWSNLSAVECRHWKRKSPIWLQYLTTRKESMTTKLAQKRSVSLDLMWRLQITCEMVGVVPNCNKITWHEFREFAPDKNQVWRKFALPSTLMQQPSLSFTHQKKTNDTKMTDWAWDPTTSMLNEWPIPQSRHCLNTTH